MKEKIKENFISSEEFVKEQEEEIIDTLIKLRDKYDVSQKELSELVNMPQPSIARLERKRITPGISTVIKLLLPLGYTLKVMPIDDNTSEV